MFYKRYNETHDFRKFKMIHTFGNDIRNNFINMYMTKDEQNHLAKYLTKPQHDSNLGKVKEIVLNSAMTLLKGREMVFKVFKSGIFSRFKQSE